MLLTVSLFNKGSFLGSLINKCRQVVRIKNEKSLNINLNPNLSNTPTIAPNVPLESAIAFTNRPLAPPANISLRGPPSVAASTKVTIEEKVGLPIRPKKPLTPYFRFMKELRPKIVASNPKMSLVDIVRQVSKKWESADPSLKQRLQEEYKKEQQEYVEKRTKYESKITDEQRNQIKELKQEKVEAKERRMMRRRIKDLGRPKKPASAFIRFIAKERIRTPQTAQQTFREWHQAATQRWSVLSPTEKEIYMQESRKDFETYRKEIAQWEEKMIRLGHIDVVRQTNLIDPPEIKPKKR
ncbi:transcription factor A, mitochondrial isoform X1 [Stomoxys calcitrans]|uniref:transcription factor A, mitochondrial isoform X1 n=1 Tax=Stomoxys calcitrans TaxID=35570 RepID=UPI0027E2628C|nr:transcription factor A, mitochondrial isoform X1 [Stomoxys calcitrans]